MVKCFESYEIVKPFYALNELNRSLDNSYHELRTIDSGADNFKAMDKFVKLDLKRDASGSVARCVIAIATDASGSNVGVNNGANAHVCYIYISSNYHSLINMAVYDWNIGSVWLN